MEDEKVNDIINFEEFLRLFSEHDINGMYRLFHNNTPDVNRVVQNLWKSENDKNKGLKNGKYYPHKTANGNLDVANGIDLDKNSKYLKEAKKGITKERADEIATKILTNELPYIDKKLSKYTEYPDTISPQMKEGLLDMYWQNKNGLYKYDNLFKAIAEGDLPIIQEESKMYYKTPKGSVKLDVRRWNDRKQNYFNYDSK